MPGSLSDDAVRIHRAQLAARLALLSASIIFTLQVNLAILTCGIHVVKLPAHVHPSPSAAFGKVANVRPGQSPGLEAAKAAKAAGKDAKGVAAAAAKAASKAAAAKASKAEEEAKKERSRLITAHQEARSCSFVSSDLSLTRQRHLLHPNLSAFPSLRLSTSSQSP